MTDTPHKRRNSASVANGRAGGRPRRSLVRRVDGAPAFVVRDGDTLALIDATGATMATTKLVAGAMQLHRAEGGFLTLVISESV